MYVGIGVFRFGIYDAISVFNIGRLATLKIFQSCVINSGYYTTIGCKVQNRRRLYHAGYKAQSGKKKPMKIIRGQKKSKIEKISQKEKVLYEPGGF